MNSLFIVLFSISLSSSIITPLVGPIIFSDTGFFKLAPLAYKMNMYALVMGIYPLGAIIGNPVLGFLSDKIDKKKVLLLAILGTILAYNICSFSFILSMFFLLVMGRFLDGLMAGRRAIAISLLADNSTNMNDVFRRAETANAVGLLVGPLFSGFIASQTKSVNLHYYSFIFGFLLILCLINLIFILKKIPSSTTLFSIEAKEKRLGLHQLCLYFIYFFIQLSFYIYIVALPPLLVVYWSFGPMAVGIVFSLLILFYSLSLIFLHPILNRQYAYQTILYAGLLLAAMFLILLSIPSRHLGLFIFINFSIVVSFSFIAPYIQAKVFDRNNKHPGLALGIQNSVLGFSCLFAAMMISILSIQYYLLLFAVAGICLFLAMISLWCINQLLFKIKGIYLC
ncbi:TPA: MFS transporter [Legionella pneumophila]|nr:MFS transporter [Legionella pneumophila subsp. pneumophila]HDV5758916.1 MFS transporter [Legionella pneumophila]HAT8906829.1 MFS transporter [Legionella pneumophila subsp. pneumophila]HDV5764897.1 MFS transporter [Legionella pneumophila]HDV5780062.1 MFS transporter [Legionella pneumophila]